MKSRLFHTGAAVLSHAGTPAVMRRRAKGLCILMFHGFTDRAHDHLDNAGELHMPITVFREIATVLATKYRVLPLEEAAAALRENRPLPPNAVVLTFDDGYASNYDLALPVLREFDLHATIFLATGFLENEFFLWPDRIEYALGHSETDSLPLDLPGLPSRIPLDTGPERLAALEQITAALKTLPQEQLFDAVSLAEKSAGCALSETSFVPEIYRPLSWNQAAEMAATTHVSLGAHTHRHLIPGRCQPETAREEISASIRLLRKKAGVARPTFAYPNGKPGDFSEWTRGILEDLDVPAAVTTVEHFNRPGTDPLALGRFGAPRTRRETDFICSGTKQAVINLFSPGHA